MIENRGKRGRWTGGKHQSQVDTILRIIDERPSTYWEIQQQMKIHMPTVRGRLSMLRNRGLVHLDNLGYWHKSPTPPTPLEYSV